jgi:hypothetical protein
MQYACPIFHHSLLNYLCEDLEKLQKRAIHIIFPTLPYAEALVEAGVDSSPSRRREAPCEGTNPPGYLHLGKRKQ